MSKSSLVTPGGPSQSFTAASPQKLITEVSARLHEIARRRRRERWWFLGGDRIQSLPDSPPGWAWSTPPEPVDLKAGVIGHRVLFEGRAPPLAGVIRVRWNLGPQHRPVLLVDFREILPRDGGGPARAHTLTVQIGWGGEGRPAGKFSKRKIRGLALNERKGLQAEWVRHRRRSTAKRVSDLLEGRPAPQVGWRQWWIESGSHKTPREATWFVLLLYLWQENLIALGPEETPDAWKEVKKFLGTEDDGRLAEILEALRRHFDFPQHWKGLRKYLSRVIRDTRLRPWKTQGREVLLAPEGAEEREVRRARGKPSNSDRAGPTHAGPPSLLPVWKAAESLGVRRETVYRWIRGKKIQANIQDGRRVLTEASLESARPLVRQRKIRTALREVLTERLGKSRAAAKKLIQRRIAAGITLEEIAHQLGKIRPPVRGQE